ncbi:helix-turn-helix transcriptional regulator [Streptomyces mirabilis]|uniref:helix-turn-helix transcriptional regulator n=1 Tax=Streptomyces mirabilis TaxID=68239 RepID=UPI002B1CD41B|nr:helix-turn-helix transcriptional regulator [Streptomyces mirabilis]
MTVRFGTRQFNSALQGVKNLPKGLTLRAGLPSVAGVVKDSVVDGFGRQREALRHFLRSRRARLSPDDVGLLATGRRHTPGLRREEVAVLAGVSASWYTWLEQGRDIRVSDGVLDAISHALRLDDTERVHLYRLAGTNPPQLTARGEAPREASRLQPVVDGWLPAPAFVVDRYWNVLAANSNAQSLLGVPSHGQNYLTSFFTDPSARVRFPDWDDMAARLVGQFRVQGARFPGDAYFDMLAEELCRADEAFADLWARHETCNAARTRVRVRVTDQQGARYEHLILSLLENSDLRLMLYMSMPVPMSHTQGASLDLVAS